MGLLRLLFREDLADPSAYRTGLDRAKAIHEFVFTTIQSLAIIAAIDILLKKEANNLFYVISGIAYLALLLYFQVGFRHFLRWLAERMEWPDRFERSLPWIFGTVSLSASIGFVFVVPSVVSAFVERNFLQ